MATIEERLTKLENRVGDTDAAYPTLVRLATDGTISFDFDGHVHAKGLDLDEDTSGALIPADDSVRWLGAGGTPREAIWGVGNDTVAGAKLRFLATVFEWLNPAGQGIMSVAMGGINGNGPAFPLDFALGLVTGQASMIVHDGNAAGTRRVTVTAGALAERLLDDTGISKWLQLATAQAAYSNFGTDSVNVSGVNTANTIVNHGLIDDAGNNLTPQMVICTPGQTGNNNPVMRTNTWGNTQFTATISHRDAATNFPALTTINFAWLAIG